MSGDLINPYVYSSTVKELLKENRERYGMATDIGYTKGGLIELQPVSNGYLVKLNYKCYVFLTLESTLKFMSKTIKEAKPKDKDE